MTCVAVIDLETTGLNPYRHDRIVELAALVLDADGTTLREFVTLINPERDIGPTRIHGLSTCDVLAAPRFSEIAGTLVEIFDGCVALAGHNIRFDHSFLTVEFDRIGYAFPECHTICTMQLAGGGSLSCACSDYGIPLGAEGHSAWHDTHATAQLLTLLLKDAPKIASTIIRRQPIAWPNIPKSTATPITRDQSRTRQCEPPSYIQKLLTRVLPEIPTDTENSALVAYTALLDRVLEDRHVDEKEGEALLEFATRWTIAPDQVRRTHWDYLLRLGAAALADGIVTDAERRDLGQVALLLGIDSQRLGEVLELAAQKLPKCDTRTVSDDRGVRSGEFDGKHVCFTGECQCRLDGELITREMAAEIATQRGLTVAESVTKKLDLLVVADPLTQSGKAKKARQYGIRILHEPVFWRALGVEVE